jgi:hypothetical protein
LRFLKELPLQQHSICCLLLAAVVVVVMIAQLGVEAVEWSHQRLQHLKLPKRTP